MEIDVEKLLAENPVVLLFTVIGIGYLLGKIRLGRIEIGSTVGVLLAGLLFGHLGFTISPGVATFGFTLFIFSVGLQAGPSFLTAFLADGRRYIALALVVAITGVALALALAHLLDLEFGLGAGLLAGALTSTPTLAGAQEAIRSGLASLPAGMTGAQAAENVSIGYAITYLFGTFGLILFVRYFPLLFRVDLGAAARELEKVRGIASGRRVMRRRGESIPLIRAYEVSAASVDKTIEQRMIELGKRGRALRVRRGAELLDAAPELVLQAGDVVSVVASLNDHQEVQRSVGGEVLDPDLLNYQITSRDIVVTRGDAIDRPIKELEIVSRYGCFATELRRSGIVLPVSGETLLQKGDILSVTGEQSQLNALAERLGYIELEIQRTDLVTFSFGIVAGTFLGLALVKLGEISVGLGSAGGLMILGILIGYVNSVNPTFGHVPAAARELLMEFGLVIFLAGIGLRAGGGIVEALMTAGPALLLSGVVVTLVPVLVAYLFGRFVLRMNPALLLGAATGAMTSTPALSVVSEAARSSVPAIGYAGTYTFANVLLTFAGTVMVSI